MTSEKTRRSENVPQRNWSTRLQSSVTSQARRPVVYAALVGFVWLYYYRPEDFIPGLVYIPMAKITGIFAILALLFAIMSGGKLKIPRALRYVGLLLFQMILCIPFALWRGGAFFTVRDKISKGVVVAMLISMVVVTMRELRKLLWIQVSAVALVVFFSVLLRHMKDGRLSGIQRSILENPNDLAINIAISFPLALVFFMNAKGFKKAIWAVALIFMAVGIVMTYSRSGLLAFILSLIVCVWEYGIKGKRRHLVVAVLVALVVGLGLALSSAHYRARVESIVLGNIEGSGDKGSLEARKTLLKKSINTALTHPLFGVGPGCFPLVDKGWIVAHNSYTELAAEDGFPALILFLLVMREAFRNLSKIRKSRAYQEDHELRLFCQALRAGLLAYLVAACFASLEYQLFSYMLVGYTCAMLSLVNQAPAARSGAQRLLRSEYGLNSHPPPVWSQ